MGEPPWRIKSEHERYERGKISSFRSSFQGKNNQPSQQPSPKNEQHFKPQCTTYDQSKFAKNLRESKRTIERSKNFVARQNAVMHLGVLANALNVSKENAGIATDVLLEACDDEHYRVRKTAAEALGDLRYSNIQIVKKLEEMITDVDEQVISAAKTALKKLMSEKIEKQGKNNNL
jgi:hypothetical protein